MQVRLFTTRPLLLTITGLALGAALVLGASGSNRYADAATQLSTNAATAMATIAATSAATISPDPFAANIALAKNFYNAFNTGNTDSLTGVIAEDWIDDPLSAGQQPGRSGFIPVVQYFRSAFPDLHHSIDDIVAEGDRVVVRGTLSGTQKGDFNGIPATNRKVTFRTIDIHQIKDGVIVETWHLEDIASLMSQLTSKQ